MFTQLLQRGSIIASVFCLFYSISHAQFPEGSESCSANCTPQSGNNYFGSTSCIPSLWSTSLDKPYVARNLFCRTGNRCLTVAEGVTAFLETRQVNLIKDTPYYFTFYFRTSCVSNMCSSGVTVHVGATSAANAGVYMSVSNMTLLISNVINPVYKQYVFTFTSSL